MYINTLLMTHNICLLHITNLHICAYVSMFVDVFVTYTYIFL